MTNQPNKRPATRSDFRAERSQINTLYYEALCCAIVFAPLGKFPLRVGGRLIFGEKIRPYTFEWYSKKCIPQDLKRFFEKSYIVPKAKEFLRHGGFEVDTYTDRFFDNLRHVEAEYLINRFRELKFSTTAFTDFRATCKQLHPNCFGDKMTIKRDAYPTPIQPDGAFVETAPVKLRKRSLVSRAFSKVASILG